MSNAVTNSQMKSFVNTVNNTLDKVVHAIPSSEYASLGPTYQFMDGLGVEHHLKMTRFFGKWAKPDTTTASVLAKECYQKWVAHEDYLWSLDPVRSIYNSPDKELHFKARALLHTWLKRFRLSPKIEFTPGASVLGSTRDGTSVYRKLSDLKHWTVTYDALEDALDLIMTTSALYNCALIHLRNYFRTANVLLPNDPDIRALIAEHVLTVVDGARGATVYKNKKVRRFINIEPTFNMLLQRKIAGGLRKILSSIGNDLETGQADHMKMISDLRYATVDWENASDSNHFLWVEWLLPPKVFAYIKQYRSYYTEIDGELYVNAKLSAMGNGFTFEVMTLCLLAYARVLDNTARVYGDDVIVCREQSLRYINALSECGWKINSTKTFTTGKFRESCGAFFHSDVGYIESYDFRWAKSPEEAIILVNKLRRMKDSHPLITKAYTYLIEKTPALLKGPIVEGAVCTKWVETSSYARAKRSDKSSVHMWKKHQRLIALVQNQWQKQVVAVNSALFYKAMKVVLGDDIECVFTFYTYMYTSRKTDDVIRGIGTWRPEEILLFSDGSWCTVKSVIRMIESNQESISYSERKRSISSLQTHSYLVSTFPFNIAIIDP